MTRKPSITASSALIGSISVTITLAPSPARAHRDAAAAPAVAGDHDAQPGQQHVGGADDAVDRALPGAVAVVEQVLGLRVVDGHDRVLRARRSLSMARRRITPVVVSSVPPTTPASRSWRFV